MAPFDRSHTTSYSSFTVTMATSCIVFGIQRDIGRKWQVFIPPLVQFTRSPRIPWHFPKILTQTVRLRKLLDGAKILPKSSRLKDATLRHRQTTDGRTARQHKAPHDGIGGAMHSVAQLKSSFDWLSYDTHATPIIRPIYQHRLHFLFTFLYFIAESRYLLLFSSYRADRHARTHAQRGCRLLEFAYYQSRLRTTGSSQATIEKLLVSQQIRSDKVAVGNLVQ